VLAEQPAPLQEQPVPQAVAAAPEAVIDGGDTTTAQDALFVTQG
jgi:hypothetical protein